PRVVRVKHAGNTADQTGQQECHQPVIANLDTRCGRGDDVISHGLETAPQRRVRDEQCEPDDEDERYRDQVVVVAGTTEVEAREDQRRYLADPRRATG